MLKEGDLVKIVGKFDEWSWDYMVWNLGDLAYVGEVQGDGEYTFLKKDRYKREYYSGIFKIETDLVKINKGGQLPLPFRGIGKWNS